MMFIIHQLRESEKRDILDKVKVVISPVVARQLLKMGNLIIDIKPNKNDVKATVFIFEDNKKLREDLTFILG